LEGQYKEPYLYATWMNINSSYATKLPGGGCTIILKSILQTETFSWFRQLRQCDDLAKRILFLENTELSLATRLDQPHFYSLFAGDI